MLRGVRSTPLPSAGLLRRRGGLLFFTKEGRAAFSSPVRQPSAGPLLLPSPHAAQEPCGAARRGMLRTGEERRSAPKEISAQHCCAAGGLPHLLR